MCGIVGLHLRDERLYRDLGSLLGGMLRQVGDRGPDSAGVGIYGDPRFTATGESAVGVLGAPEQFARALDGLGAQLIAAGPTTVVRAPLAPEVLRDAVSERCPGVTVTSWGNDLVVLKGAGHPSDLATAFGLDAATGWQGIAHTRMATESAVTAAHSHPFSVGADL